MRTALIARNSIWTALDQGLGLVGGFVVAVVVARALGPTLLGSFAFVMWIVSIAGSMGAYGVGQATEKFGGEYFGRGEPATARGIIQTAFRWQFGLGLLVVGGSWIAIWLTMPSGDYLWSAVAVLSLLASMMMAVSARAIEIRQDFRLNVIPSTLSNLVHVAGSLLALWMGWGLLGLTGALLLSRLIDAVVRYAFYRGSWAEVASRPMPPELGGRFARFAGQASLLMLLNIVVWDRSEVVFLKRFCDIQEVAFYSMSFGLIRQILILPQSLSWASGVNLLVEYGKDPGGQGRFAGRMTVILAVIACPLAFGVLAVSAPAVRVIYGEAYLPAIPVLAIVALFGLPQALLPPAQLLLVAHDRQGFLVVWGAVLAAVNISLDLLLIPRGAAVGAAIANASAQTLALVGIWWYARGKAGLELPFRDLGRVVLSAATMAAGAWTVTRILPPLPGLVCGIILGVVLYPVMLRLTRSLRGDDRERLLSLSSFAPGPFRPTYIKLVRLITG